jgi:hypothetical protein
LAGRPEGRDDFSWGCAIDDTDAFVARRQAGLQERDQDLVPFPFPGKHPADVIAQFGVESSDPQGNAIRHCITTNQQEVVRS